MTPPYIIARIARQYDQGDQTPGLHGLAQHIIMPSAVKRDFKTVSLPARVRDELHKYVWGHG